MNRWKSCNGWNDPMQWPEEERGEYVPDLCYACHRQEHVVKDVSAADVDPTITPEEDANELDKLDLESEPEEGDADE